MKYNVYATNLYYKGFNYSLILDKKSSGKTFRKRYPKLIIGKKIDTIERNLTLDDIILIQLHRLEMWNREESMLLFMEIPMKYRTKTSKIQMSSTYGEMRNNEK